MDNWRSGEWRAICDVCGFEFYASELVSGVSTNQRGLKVCKRDLDKQNPQEFVRSKEESLGVPWARPGDNEGVIVPIELTDLSPSTTLTASLTDVLYVVEKTGSGSGSITLPTANDSVYKGISITIVITSPQSSENNIGLFGGAGSALLSYNGLGNILRPGTTTKIKNIPSQNKWLREA